MSKKANEKSKSPVNDADPLRMDVNSEEGHTVEIKIYNEDKSQLTNLQLIRALQYTAEQLLGDGSDD